MVNLEHTAAVTRMQTFIEKHLDEEITLHVLAQQAAIRHALCQNV